MADLATVKETARQFNQGHLLQWWDTLDVRDREYLLNELQTLDYDLIQKQLQASVLATGQATASCNPIADTSVLTLNCVDTALRKQIQKRGLTLISLGRLATVCLAGGQGTRLGSSDPKGMFNIGLPTGASLFQIQAERIRRLEALAAETTGHAQTDRLRVPFVIMTSPATDVPTRRFFAAHANFGLAADQVVFAVQEELPCVQEDGRIILADRCTVARAPGGNGAVFSALVKSGILDRLQAGGVQYIDCYCVDNALARVADPELAGHADLCSADVCAKVLAKAYPTERVGVFARRGGSTAVVEYSEIDEREASAVNPGTGRLKYNWANISHFCFTPDFVRRAAAHLDRGAAALHVARKTIPSVDGPVQGVKLEAFIFDPFPLARDLRLMEVERASHFAPVKNAEGAPADTPSSARAAVLALSARCTETRCLPPDPAVGIIPLEKYMCDVACDSSN